MDSDIQPSQQNQQYQPYNPEAVPAPQPVVPAVSTIYDEPFPSGKPALNTEESSAPMPVVRVLSPMGVEYVFMTISLFGGLLGLVIALLALVNGQSSFSVLAFPVALLLASVPVFAVLFLHLKKLELAQPVLRHDPSKRRSTQFTQIFSFVVCFSTVVGILLSILEKMGGNPGPSVVKILLDGLVILAVFGGVLFYYWHNEHRR